MMSRTKKLIEISLDNASQEILLTMCPVFSALGQNELEQFWQTIENLVACYMQQERLGMTPTQKASNAMMARG
jgi:hypothetical protein